MRTSSLPENGPRAAGPGLLACLAAAVALPACGGDDGPQPSAGGSAAPAGAAEGSETPPAPAPVPPPLRGPWLDAAELAELPAEGPGWPDEAAARGLAYENVSGAPGKPTILGANGAGVALLDLGPDGDLDAAFGQGLASLAAAVEGPGATLEVFENQGEGRFTRADAPPNAGWWTGLAAGDLDGDGDADLVAGGYGGLLLCAQREGRLEPWSDAPGGGLMAAGDAGDWLVPGAEREAGRIPLWTTSLALLDAELDGDLDLYVGRYLELDPLDPPVGELGEGALAFPCWWKGMDVYCGPRGMTPQPDRILRGDGAGGFEDASAAWLPDHEPGFTLAVGAFDADFDGDTDLYVANDSTANLMLVNEVRGEASAFVDRGLTAGVALNPDGAAEAGMGVAVGDVDRNGRVDLAVTNFSDEPTHLYLARERGFSNQTYRMGLAHETRRLLSWSAHLDDFDGDGFLELFTANGHVYPQADAPDTGTRYRQPDSLWHVRGESLAKRVWPLRSDSIFALERGTRGSAVGDVDGDGALDLVAVAIDAPCALGINRTGAGANRLVLHLEGAPDRPAPDGRRSTRDAFGAKAILVPALPAGTPATAEYAVLREVQTAVGYQSSSAPELHFGTGAVRSYADIKLIWPSGRTESLGAGDMGRRLFVREGDGIVREETL
ncbi:MAG: CRTAC1 family protein [Planctomycetota bacterium]